MSRDKDSFLSRWEQRKAAVAREAEEEAADAAVPIDAPPAEAEEKSDEEILAELGLKHPDALEPGDDFRAFMAAAVPDRLRRLALRKLWLSNPTLANLDGLVEYGEDYTDAATVVENMQTAYQVGKGIVRKVLEAEEEGGDDAPDAAGDLQAARADPDAGDPDEPASEDAETELDPPADVVEEAHDLALADIEDVRPVRRRMRFQLPENSRDN